MIIPTPRLELVSGKIEHLRADVENPQALPGLIQATVPDNWPDPMLGEVLPLFLKMMEEDSRYSDWLLWYWLKPEPHLEERTLIGAGGFKNIPEADGRVEIGCGVLPQFQQRGYATEGIAGLVEYAISLPDIMTVYADTDITNIGARRTLEKCSFVEIGSGSDPGTIRYSYRFNKI